MVDLDNQQEWYYRQLYEDTQEQQRVLLGLKYQFAFAIITIIAVIWTVFGTILFQNCGTEIIFNSYILFPVIFSIIIITLWRFFLNYINLESNGLIVGSYFYLNKLGLIDNEETRIEKLYNLTENDNYKNWIKSLSTKEQKNLFRLDVGHHLWKHLNWNLLLFDYVSFFVIFIASILSAVWMFSKNGWNNWLGLFILVCFLCLMLIMKLILWVRWGYHLIEAAIVKAKKGEETYEFSLRDLFAYRFRLRNT